MRMHSLAIALLATTVAFPVTAFAQAVTADRGMLAVPYTGAAPPSSVPGQTASMPATAIYSPSTGLPWDPETEVWGGGSSGSVDLRGFAKTGNATVTATTAGTARATLGSPDDGTVVENTSTTTTAYVKFGDSSVTAGAPTDMAIGPGQWIFLNADTATHMAAATVSGTAALRVSTGTGRPEGGFTLDGTEAAVNLAQVAGVTTPVGHGVAATALRVELPTDGTGVVGLNTGSNVIGKVSIDQTTPGTTNATQEIAGTTGGTSSYHVIAAASDNHVVIKNGAGQVYSLDATSIHTTYQYVRLYDAGTGFNGCNSATNIIGGWIIPGAAAGAGAIKAFPVGRSFTNGLAVCITGAFSDTDTTNATASVLSLNVGYK